jgi:ABC-type multidrug transport system ATPase subunit
MSLLGANGSGKTTLINILLGKANMKNLNKESSVLIKSFSIARNAFSL